MTPAIYDPLMMTFVLYGHLLMVRPLYDLLMMTPVLYDFLVLYGHFVMTSESINASTPGENINFVFAA